MSTSSAWSTIQQTSDPPGTATIRHHSQLEPKKGEPTVAPIRLALVDDHRMLLGALTEWIRNAADDISMVAAVRTASAEIVAS